MGCGHGPGPKPGAGQGRVHSETRDLTMPMAAFYHYFPELAVKETRTVTVWGNPELPDGRYEFIELYCDEVGCDCRRVLIMVVSPSTGKVLATINYGWETQRYYEQWMGDKELAAYCVGATLDPLGLQSEYAVVLLKLFERVLLPDEAYVARLKRHYALFKAALEEGSTPESERQQGKRKRRRSRRST